MPTNDAIDYYKILGARPDADAADIARNFHRLARLYHPDNQDTGDREQFDLIVEAHNTLKDPAKRDAYNARHPEVFTHQPTASEANGDSKLIGRDVDVQSKLLSTFYKQRRNNIRSPGLSEFQLEEALGCTIEELEFHLWYLRSKGWIERTDTGLLAISVNGVDHVNAEYQRKETTRLLMDRTSMGDGLA